MTNKQVPTVRADDPELLKALKDSIFPDASDESIKMAIAYCAKRNLDPLQRPVHIVQFKDKNGHYRDVIMPGLNMYRVQASRTGCLTGISEPEFGPVKKFVFGSGKEEVTVNAPEWARITVSRFVTRNNSVGEFSHIEFFEEVVSLTKNGVPNTFWRKRPRGMLGKCAESGAIRKAFPELDRGGEDTMKENSQENVTQNVAILDSESLAARALEAAKKGTCEYTAFWVTLTTEEKNAVRKAFPDGLKQIAQDADEERTVEAEQ